MLRHLDFKRQKMSSHYNSLIFNILLTCLLTAHGTKYEFFLDNDEVFDKCSDIPGSNGIQDLYDMSGLNIDFHEGQISGKGNTTIVWQGVQPSDRIEVS